MICPRRNIHARGPRFVRFTTRLEFIDQLSYTPDDDRLIFLDRGSRECAIPDLACVCMDLHVARTDQVAFRYPGAPLTTFTCSSTPIPHYVSLVTTILLESSSSLGPRGKLSKDGSRSTSTIDNTFGPVISSQCFSQSLWNKAHPVAQ